jgi:hypothetical protein
MGRRFRTGLLATVAVALGLLLPLGLAELILQFSPVMSGLYATPVNAREPIGHFEPDHRFTYSVGTRFELVVRGRTNNLGWVNDQDYDSTATSPLLAVIGDSYVEALMVPYRATLQGRLASTAGPAARVYSFGVSGAPLAHYLVLADYARHVFHPTTAAVVVVGNDFDESLRRYKVAPGLWGFAEDSAGRLRLQREDYRPSLWKRLVRRSALVRYLMLNLKLEAMIAQWRARPAGGADSAAFAGNVRAVADSARVADSRRAVDEFLARLPAASGVAPACLAIVIDGVRPQLYDPASILAGDSSYFGRMRGYLMDRAHEAGFQVVDLQPAFIARYAVMQQRFEYPGDGHWNGRGHEVAADATQRTAAFTSLAAPPGARTCAHPTR